MNIRQIHKGRNHAAGFVLLLKVCPNIWRQLLRRSKSNHRLEVRAPHATRFLGLHHPFFALIHARLARAATARNGFAFLLLLVLFWRHNQSTHKRRYSQWERSFLCQRCGTVTDQE